MYIFTVVSVSKLFLLLVALVDHSHSSSLPPTDPFRLVKSLVRENSVFREPTANVLFYRLDPRDRRHLLATDPNLDSSVTLPFGQDHANDRRCRAV